MDEPWNELSDDQFAEEILHAAMRQHVLGEGAADAFGPVHLENDEDLEAFAVEYRELISTYANNLMTILKLACLDDICEEAGRRDAE